MNTQISFRHSLRWGAFLLLAFLIVGFTVPQSVQAEYTLEPEGITGVFDWINTAVDTPDAFGYMGNKSLRIDSTDRPRVVYGGQGLYYATWTGSVWDLKTVDASAGVGYYASLALDSSNIAYIAYYDAVNADLKYAKGSGSSWTVSVIDGEDIINGEEEEVGGFASIDLDSSKNPHIVYFDDTHDDLLYIRWTGSQWSTPEKIDDTGVVGLYISMYINGSDVHVSYYDYTHKALKYAVRKSGTWTVSTVDDPDGKNVGTYTSIDVDYLGFPHISYYNETDKELKYAMLNAGTWSIDVVDDNHGGKYSSIETDSGIPYISYFSEAQDNLRYATKPASSWQTSNVDSNGTVGYYTSLAVDDAHEIHITYYRTDTSELRHAERKNGNWSLETIATAGNLGLYTSIATGTNGKNYISYYDGRNDDLKFAEMEGTTPTITTIDSSGDVGQYASIALNNNNDPRIAYYDATNTALKFASRAGTTWSIQTVDNTNDVGQYASLAVDSSGAAHIAYYDVTNTGIRYVVQNGTSWTTPQQLDWVDNVGKFVTLALDSNNYPHIAYYDTTNTALKYVYWTGTVWSILTIDNSADVGQNIALVVDAAGNTHVSYYDATNNTIKYAVRNGTTWTSKVVAYLNTAQAEDLTFNLQSLFSSGNHATAIQVDSANLPFIAFYDTNTNVLKFAQPFGAIWVITNIDASGSAGEYLSMDFGPNEHPYLSYFSNATQGLKLAIAVKPLSYLPLITR